MAESFIETREAESARPNRGRKFGAAVGGIALIAAVFGGSWFAGQKQGREQMARQDEARLTQAKAAVNKAELEVNRANARTAVATGLGDAGIDHVVAVNSVDQTDGFTATLSPSKGVNDLCRTAFDVQTQPKGHYELVWDIQDATHRTVKSVVVNGPTTQNDALAFIESLNGGKC